VIQTTHMYSNSNTYRLTLVTTKQLVVEERFPLTTNVDYNDFELLTK